MATQLPIEIRDYLVSITLTCRSAAYFKVTTTGQILDWGGNLEEYDIDQIEVGVPIWNYLFFIDSFFPLGEIPGQLSCIKFKGDISVNIHIFTQGDAGWVLLLDASYDEQWRSRLQQKGNEFNLLRQQYNKLIQGVLQHHPEPHRDSSSTTPPQSMPLSAIPISQTQQRESSLLLIKVCELASSESLRSPTSTLKLLNAYLALITQIVAEEGGIIHHVFGETAVALFGLLPSCKTPSQQATDAARRMILRFQDFEQGGTSFRSVGLNVGAAITTGVMASGMVQSQGYRSLTALGDNIQRALQLSEWIRPGIIIVDNTTFDQLGQYQEQFARAPIVPSQKVRVEQRLYAQDVCHASVYS